MKNLLYIFTAIVLLASCQKHGDMMTGDKAVATFEIETPFEFEIKSTTNGNASAVNALWYGVYHKKENGSYVYMSDMSAYVSVTDASQKISVPITLFRNQEYKIILVAQHIEQVTSQDGSSSSCYTYIINEDGQMSLNPKAKITDGEQLDAFVYCEETGIILNSYKKEVTLSRPLAQVNISTSAPVVPEKITVEASGTAKSYDIFAKEYSAQTTTLTFADLTCSPASVSGTTELATVYLLPTDNRVNLTLTMKYAGGTEVVKEVQAVTVAPNFKTNVTGNI